MRDKNEGVAIEDHPRSPPGGGTSSLSRCTLVTRAGPMGWGTFCSTYMRAGCDGFPAVLCRARPRVRPARSCGSLRRCFLTLNFIVKALYLSEGPKRRRRRARAARAQGVSTQYNIKVYESIIIYQRATPAQFLCAECRTTALCLAPFVRLLLLNSSHYTQA